ncbi:MAG: GHKL domain-containing protein [Lachnospiraceae bacterium]|nr:GHKL domain-containing protein [Lachnospiraceae bacterium]
MRELNIFLITLVIIVVINLILWLFILPRMVNKKIARFQNDLVNRHYDEVETMYRKMRGWRHDYHNHIQVLKVHMGMKQYEEAAEYLEHLEKDLTTVDTVIKTGNVMVDAILNSKLAMIKERKIQVDVTAIVPESISISGIDLSVLIGNILDNAMEACMKLPEEKRFLRIYIDILKKQLYISVTNSMDGRAKKRGNLFLTNKEGDHGFGLLRIDSIVSKYHGFINRQTENGVFATEVMLPLTKIS